MHALQNKTIQLNGGAAYLGQTKKLLMPAWMVGAPLNDIIDIPGTAGAGGAAINAYSGFARRKAELIAAACGGHGDSSDNRVVSIDLSLDAPAWVLRHAPSAPADVIINAGYYADGLPSSRHTYYMNTWVPEVNRVMMMGGRFTYGMWTSHSVDGFNLDTNQWDAPGTWPDNASFGGGAFHDGNGDIWTGGNRFDVTDRTFHAHNTTHYSGGRYPFILDTKRNQVFGMAWGDNEEFGTLALAAGVQSTPIRGQTPTQTQITFRPSAALTKWLNDKPIFAGMDYDSVNDYFLFYACNPGKERDFYKIIPNDTSVWDMELFQPVGSVPPAGGGGGIYSRIHYIPELRGFILMPTSGANILFLRTAP